MAMVNYNDPKNYKNCSKKNYFIYVCKPPLGTIVINKLEQNALFRQLGGRGYFTANEIRKMQSEAPDKFNFIQNLVASGQIYAVTNQTPFVLFGTYGEMWTISTDKLVATYNFERDGSPVQINNQTLYDRMKSGYLDWTLVRTSKSAQGGSNMACFVPTAQKFQIQTSYGAVLNGNDPGVSHGKGDFIVCGKNPDGSPDLNNRWIVNGYVFRNTYDNRGWERNLADNGGYASRDKAPELVSHLDARIFSVDIMNFNRICYYLYNVIKDTIKMTYDKLTYKNIANYNANTKVLDHDIRNAAREGHNHFNAEVKRVIPIFDFEAFTQRILSNPSGYHEFNAFKYLSFLSIGNFILNILANHDGNNYTELSDRFLEVFKLAAMKGFNNILDFCTINNNAAIYNKNVVNNDETGIRMSVDFSIKFNTVDDIHISTSLSDDKFCLYVYKKDEVPKANVSLLHLENYNSLAIRNNYYVKTSSTLRGLLNTTEDILGSQVLHSNFGDSVKRNPNFIFSITLNLLSMFHLFDAEDVSQTGGDINKSRILLHLDSLEDIVREKNWGVSNGDTCTLFVDCEGLNVTVSAKHNNKAFKKTYEISLFYNVDLVSTRIYVDICKGLGIHPARSLFGSSKIWRDIIFPNVNKSIQDSTGKSNEHLRVEYVPSVQFNNDRSKARVEFNILIDNKVVGTRHIVIDFNYKNFNVNSNCSTYSKILYKKMNNSKYISDFGELLVKYSILGDTTNNELDGKNLDGLALGIDDIGSELGNLITSGVLFNAKKYSSAL